MKFLVDAQMPRSLAEFLVTNGLDAIHTLDLPDANRTSDQAIIDLCDKDNRVVVSKDIDFLESFLLRKKPGKLLVVRTGNIPNQVLIKLFGDHLQTRLNMLERSDLIELGADQITEY